MYSLSAKEVSSDIKASNNLLPLIEAFDRRRCDRGTPCARCLRIGDTANCVYVPFAPGLPDSTFSEKSSHKDLHLLEQINYEPNFFTRALLQFAALSFEGATNGAHKQDIIDGSIGK